MGSLAFAVGGGLAGAGQGLAEVGKEQQQAQRDATILRLQNQYASERQQVGFTEQEKLQGKTQEFEHGEKEREYQVQAAAAGASRAFLTQQEAATEAAAQKRTETTGQYRVAARKAGMGTPKSTPEWTQGHYEMQGSVVKDPSDPSGKKTMMVPGGTILTQYNNRTHQAYVQIGNKFMPYDASKGASLPNAGSVRNAPQAAVTDLASDPYGMTPDGKSTKADAYLQQYGHLPMAYFDALKNHDPNAPAPGGPLGKAAPPGSSYSEGPSYGRSLGDAQDAQDDAEDREDYANTGDAGPQASDTAPAQ